MTKSYIPTISVCAKSIPEAWEMTVLDVWDKGVDIKTQYDKSDDPPSKDATVMVTVEDDVSHWLKTIIEPIKNRFEILDL